MNSIYTLGLVALIGFACRDPKSNTEIGYRNDLSISNREGKPSTKDSFYFDPESFRDTCSLFSTVTISDIKAAIKNNEEIEEEFRIEIDSFKLKWFSEVLADNQEPILSNFYLGKDIYRLTWLRTFHQGVVIKIHNTGTKWQIETSWLRYNDKEIKVSRRDLPRSELQELEQLLNTNHFFTSKSYQCPALVTDGSEWIFEAHTSEKYHFLNRWSPEFGQSDGLREIGEYLIQLSDARNEEIY